MSTLHIPTLRESMAHGREVNLHPLERYISAAGGAYLAWTGMRRGIREGAVHMLVGAAMLRRSMTGHSYAYQAFGLRTASSDAAVPRELGVHVKLAMTIGRPRAEVFAFWSKLENLPGVMRHLRSIENRGGGISRWTVNGPMDRQVEWDARIINQVENEQIAWKSLDGSHVDSAGTVLFRDAPRGRGTEVTIELQYNPPGGFVGAFGAMLLGKDARTMIEADCWRVKEYLETGEVATTEGQPKGPPRSRSRPPSNTQEQQHESPMETTL